ncbi:MAG: hypothetical protein WC878_05105 [Candidatus Paceibacterota bacterium]|jgi:hypothetical protein
MKIHHLSYKFLSGALSFFVIFMIVCAVSTSFFFFAKDVRAQSAGDSGQLVPCGNQEDPSAAQDCQFNHFIELVQRVMNFLLFVVAVPFAAISFAWAGWLYLSAAGNESKVKEAHQIFGAVALGLCIALAAWLIVHAIIKGLGVSEQYNFLGG